MAQPEIVPGSTQTPEVAEIEASAESRAPSTEQAEPETEERGRQLRGILIAFLTVAVLVLAYLLIDQTRTSRALESQVSALEGEVVRAEATVAAHELRLEQVRDQVGGLAAQVGALQALVERDVGPDPAQPLEAPSSGASGASQ